MLQQKSQLQLFRRTRSFPPVSLLLPSYRASPLKTPTTPARFGRWNRFVNLSTSSGTGDISAPIQNDLAMGKAELNEVMVKINQAEADCNRLTVDSEAWIVAKRYLAALRESKNQLRQQGQLEEVIRDIQDLKLQLRKDKARGKYSVTDSPAVGRVLIDARRYNCRAAELLGQIRHCVAPSVVTEENFKTQWSSAESEAVLHRLAVKGIQAISVGANHFVLDTHKSGYYQSPIAKINIALSASSKAFWTTLHAPIELKLDYDDSSRAAGVGQLNDRWEKVVDAQPDRQHMVGCLLTKDTIELWQFCKNGDIKSTGVLPFEWDAGSPGYQVLRSFVHASGAVLGYKPLPTPSDFKAENGLLLTCLQPMAYRPGHRLVYNALCGGSHEQVVVKLGQEADIDREVMCMKELSGQRGVPTVLAHGPMPEPFQGATHFYVVSPLGVHLGSTHPTTVVLMAVTDVVNVLQKLADHSLLHRDLSPGNIILGTQDGAEQGILIDYHVASGMAGRSDITHPLCITGTMMYRALRLHTYGGRNLDLPRPGASGPGRGMPLAARHTLATDLESLFYCLLDIASEGKAIVWRHAGSEDEMYRDKAVAMYTWDTWCRAVSKCREDLQPAIIKLHDLIFGNGEASYIAASVTAKDFIAQL